MTKKSPNVIFACEYLLGLNNKSNRSYGSNYENNRNNDVDDMFDYFSNPKKSVVGMFDYYEGKYKDRTFNLIKEDGSVLSKEEIDKRKQNYKKYIKNSNIWKGIVSFNNDFIDQNITFRDLEKRFAKEVMPQFLKFCGFKDVKNMDYIFSIHTNTKHYHIHLAFIEKKPNYVYGNGKVGYRRLGMLSGEQKNYLKRLVQLSIERDKVYSPLLTQTNKDIDYLKKYFLPTEKNFVLKDISDIKTEENILRLGELIKQYREKQNNNSKKVNYNSIRKTELGKDILKLTREIKNYLYNDKNSLLYEDLEIVKSDLEKLNQYFNKLDEDNHIKEYMRNNSLIDNKNKYIDNYVSNAIINHALFKYNNISMSLKSRTKQDKITIEDIIQELAYQHNTTKRIIDDKERRKKILHNYFSNNTLSAKLPSKYKIEKAVKNLNNEMEDASKEFSKLFENQYTK